MKNTYSKQKEKTKSHIPFRLNLLFFIVFILFVILIMGFGYLQIIKGEAFKAEVERTETTLVRGNVPRGEIYDSRLRPLVANEAKNTIMYTRGAKTDPENMANVAYNLAYLIDIPHTTPSDGKKSDLTERDMLDYFYATNKDKVNDRVKAFADKEKKKTADISYAESLKFIEEDEIKDYTDHELKAIAIFTKMNAAYALSTVNIKNQDVTEKEIAHVSENLVLLPGVTVGADWDRIYPQDDTLRSILGNVSSESQGLPDAHLNEYLAKGYSRNERVGRSLLESQYESVLRGSKTTSKTETNNMGDIIEQEEIYSGSKGNNLVLSMDMDFQSQVDEITLEALSKRSGLSDSVYAVAMNPQNGDVLAMSGKKIKDGKVVDDTLGNVSNSFEMGSSIKAATVLSGYMDGVISLENNTIVDRPLKFAGSENIRSLFNRYGSVTVNDISALQRSSNIYMSFIAMRMGGYWDYVPNHSLPINAEQTVKKMREYYEQFGLGSKTGIDLPNESTGQKGAIDGPGKALFLSFGQFDTYTPLQLAQYISTVANGGTRYAPRLVSEIRETNPDTGDVGALVEEIPPKVLNHINVSEAEMKRVQEGLYQVTNTPKGTGYSHFSNAEYSVSGKTGTAQASYWGEIESQRGKDVTNMTFVAYAPVEKPEIAVAVVIPYLPDSGSTNQWVARQILDAYFEKGNYKNKDVSNDKIDDDSEE